MVKTQIENIDIQLLNRLVLTNCQYFMNENGQILILVISFIRTTTKTKAISKKFSQRASQNIRGTISNRKVVEKRLKWVGAITSLLLASLFIYTMIQVAPKIETATDAHNEQEIHATEGDIVVSEAKDAENDKETNQEDIDYVSIEGYLYELKEGESPESFVLDFYANQVDSSLPDPESGMKNIAIEFTFEILDSSAYEMNPEQNFLLLDGDETYKPEQVEILESVGLDEGYLRGVADGKIKGIVEYVIPERENGFELLFNSKELGPGILVKFD